MGQLSALPGVKDGVVKSACALCPACCGIDVHIENGKVVKVTGMREHPVSRGQLCPKGASILDHVNSPDRLQYPMRRQNGGWQRISWQEALDIIAGKLLETKEKYGPQGFVLCRGMIGGRQGVVSHELIRRFCDLYGTPNAVSVDSMCFRPRVIGYALTTGKLGVPDVQRAKLVVLWGQNPTNSNPPLAKVIQRGVEAREKDLIVVDPRAIPLAQKARLHLQPRPGTDCALLLGVLNVIVTERLYDKAFVEKWTSGFDKFEKHIEKYSPETVEKITWVSAASIRELARTFATTKPACIVQGGNSLDQNANGVQNARAVAILQAITGNFDVPGGFAVMPSFRVSHARFLDKMVGNPLGMEKYPLFYKTFDRLFGESQVGLLHDAILNGKPHPVKAMLVTLSNPALNWPNSRRSQQALKKLDFLAVMDMFMTDTASLADVVLPAASFLERTDIVDIYRMHVGVPYIMLRKRISQVGECWTDTEFYSELARRMGYAEYFPWETDEEVVDYLLKPSGLTYKFLTEEKPEGTSYGTIKYTQYETRGFPTPSGKVDLYSEPLAQLGYDPMPTFREAPESPISSPELSKDYPLVLTTGARMLEYFHSGLHNIPRLAKTAPRPIAEIHPDTAKEYGIKDGDSITVETKRGSIGVDARVTKAIAPGMVAVPHGWREANVNMLTDEGPADPITGCPGLKGLLCRIRLREPVSR